MSRTRRLIEEILEIRDRRKTDDTTIELFTRMLALENAFEKRTDVEPELLRYFPVALVASLEGFFRLAIKEIIDLGSPYLENAARLLTNVKFDYDFIKALHGKQITIGDFVAHQLPLSSLTNIQTDLSALLGIDFLQELGVVSDRVAHEIYGKPKVPILTDPDKTYAGVSRTFELRHIICHELASNFETLGDEIEVCFFSTTQFLKASGELIQQTIYPGLPLTQTDINIAAGKELNLLLEESDALVRELKDTLEESDALYRNPELNLEEHRAEEFGLVVSAWKAYMENWANFEANGYKGGSMWSMVYSYSAANIVRDWIAQIKRYLKQYRSEG